MSRPLKSLARYTRLGREGPSNDVPQQSKSWSPLGTSSPVEYEMQDQSKEFRSGFINDITTPTSPNSPVSRHEDDYSRSLVADNVGAGRVNTGFSPLFMRRWVLLCFAVLWVLVIVSLQIIYSVSQGQKGLATTRSNLRYLWAYGPTAFLVVVTVIWRQVDYAAKYVQPWAELAKGPLPAEKTLLLDYITPLQVVALWRAARYRHFTVISTILVFVFVKVITVLSTGLLTLDLIDFDGIPQAMRATTVFDGSPGLQTADIDARAATGLLGNRNYNMALPNGTTLQYAFQSFEPNSRAPNDTVAYNASVEVFVADGWNCESGKLTYDSAFDHMPVDSTGYAENTPTMLYYNTTIKLNDCEIYNGHLDAPSWYFVQNDTTPRYGYWGTFQAVNCSNLEPSDPKFTRYSLSVAYSEGTGQNEQTMLNSSNVVCLPSYRIRQGYVSVFLNGTQNGNITFSEKQRELERVSGADLALAVQASLGQTSVPTAYDDYDITADNVLRTMIELTPDFKVEMLLDAQWLATKSKQVYQETAAQIAALYLLRQGDSTPLEGYITRNEARLVVRNLPTRLMQGSCAAMLVLTVTMIFTMPQNVVPRSVESLAAIAVILARSPSLRELMHNTGHMDIIQLERAMSGHRYMSAVVDAPQGKTFSIRAIAGSESMAPDGRPGRIKWVRPFVLHRIVMTLTLLLALGVLITLEVLYRQSRTENGIVDVDPDSAKRYAWLYTPTAVLVFLATTFNILDFELEFNDPYHALSRGFAHARSSLLWDPLKNISLKTCLYAFQHSRFALVASSLSVVFAPLLTIAVSGLFTPQAVPRSTSISASAATWFNISSYDTGSGTVAGSFPIPALILQGNMSYTQWTLGELAYPSLDLSTQSLGISNASGGSLTVDTPAARAAVDCTLVPSSQMYNVSYLSEYDSPSIQYNLSTPEGCGNGGWIWTDYIWYSSSVNTPVPGDGYFGSIEIGTGQITRASDNATIRCPQNYIIYGNIKDGNLDHFSMYACYLGLETVQTRATVSFDLATVVSLNQTFKNTTQSFQDYWPVESYSAPYFTPTDLNHTDESFDDFTNVMVYGKDGVSASELLDSDTIIRQYTHTYRQWMAQYVNSYMRNPIDALAQNTTNIAGALPDSLAATYHDPNRYRLFLSEVSTRILQAVIAFLLVCGIVIFCLVDMTRVLPKPVGSIGAVASLLAGSRLVNEKSGLIPRGSEWLSDGEMRRRGMWNGEEFRMGWWVSEGWKGEGVDDCMGVDEHNRRFRDGYVDGAGEGMVGQEKRQFRIDVRSKFRGRLKGRDDSDDGEVVR